MQYRIFDLLDFVNPAERIAFRCVPCDGHDKKEIIQMLINEQIFSSGISILIGAGLGVLSSILFVPLVQIFYASTDQTVPLAVVFKAFDMIRLFSVIGIVIVICMVVLGKLISKINISQALKLGED